MALYKLSSGLDNYRVGEKFGYGEETARRSFIDFVNFISKNSEDFI
jgi:hypothetical protein